MPVSTPGVIQTKVRSPSTTMQAATATGDGTALDLLGGYTGGFFDISVTAGPPTFSVTFYAQYSDSASYNSSTAVAVDALKLGSDTVNSVATSVGRYVVYAPGAGRIWARVTAYSGSGTVNVLGRPAHVTVDPRQIAKMPVSLGQKGMSGSFPVVLASDSFTAHDAADAGNPIKTGGRATTANTLRTAVASGDRTDHITDVYGRQMGVVAGLGSVVTFVAADITGSSTAFDGTSAMGGILTQNMQGGLLGSSDGTTYGSTSRFYVPLRAAPQKYGEARLDMEIALADAFNQAVSLILYSATAVGTRLKPITSTITLPASTRLRLSFSADPAGDLGTAGTATAADQAHYEIPEMRGATPGIVFEFNKTTTPTAGKFTTFTISRTA